MSIFTLVMFWAYLFCVVVALIQLIGEHPRLRKPATVGEDCASFIIHLAIMAWAAYLTWGAQ